MLADRHYMRRNEPPFQWSLTVVVLVLNVVVFFLEHSGGAQSRGAFLEYGALSVEGLKRGFVWQFITFQFLHGGMSHLVLNSVGLYFFGRAVEGMLGKREFIKLYLISGVLGGVLQALLGLAAPQFSGPMVGASAGICGLIAAFAVLAPDSHIYIFFVLPIRARYLLPAMIILPVILLLSSAEGNIAHAAHLGGTLGGIAYLKLFYETGRSVFHWPRSRQATPRRELVKASTARRSFWQKDSSARIDDLPPAEFISREVDPILDKISAQGIQSLTDRERRILEAARARMTKR